MRSLAIHVWGSAAQHNTRLRTRSLRGPRTKSRARHHVAAQARVGRNSRAGVRVPQGDTPCDRESLLVQGGEPTQTSRHRNSSLNPPSFVGFVRPAGESTMRRAVLLIATFGVLLGLAAPS